MIYLLSLFKEKRLNGINNNFKIGNDVDKGIPTLYE